MDDEAPTTEQNQDKAAPERSFSLLASERFGSAFKGEVPKETEPKDAPETPPEELDLPEAAEVADDPPVSDEPPVEVSAEEERSVSTVSELIEYLEADPEWFDGLKVPVKVDGKSGEASLKDLVNSYQIQEAAEHRLSEAKTKAKAILDSANEKTEAINGQFAIAAKLIENAEGLLNKEVKGINWADLRENDPAEYSAKKADIAERRESIDKMKREAVEAYQSGAAKSREEMEAAFHAHLVKEHEALMEKLPEWRDESKAKAGKAKVAEYLNHQGFSQQEVSKAADHRLILMARKAMLYDELQANTNAAIKKVAKVPKVIKPGTQKPKETINREQRDKLKARLKQSGSIDDAFALLKSRRT